MSMQQPVTAPKISLFIADVDGTLVTQDKVLTDRAIKAVHDMHDAGVIFAITSGRPPRGMSMLVEPLAIEAPISAFNGGLFVKPDMSIIEQHVLPNGIPEQVIKMIEDHKLDAWIYRGKEWYVHKKDAPHVAREAWTVKFEPNVVESYDGLLDNVVKIVGVSDDLDAVAKCEADAQKEFGDKVSAARSQPYYLDVTHPDANKGTVVKRLSEYFKIAPENIATIGDMPNDVLMFKKSGFSIAMGNASPEVQHSASAVVASNQDEGFAKAVEQYILPAVKQ